MHVLVHERVLHDDDEFQLAHAYWIVQVPDLWWRSNADSNTNTYANANSDTYADTNSYTYADANAYSDSNADTCAATGSTHEPGWESGIFESGQLVMDG